MEKQLYASLDKNLIALKKMFDASSDYYAKEICIAKVPAAILMFDNLSSLRDLWEILLECTAKPGIVEGIPAQAEDGAELLDELMRRTDIPAEPETISDFTALTEKLTAGFAILLLDGSCKAMVFSVQSIKYRSVSTPSAEGNIRGSREGFTEPLRVNISLLRRLIRTDDFVAETAFSAADTHTEYAICYCRSKVNESMLQRLKSRLEKANPAVLLDSSYFVPWIQSGKQNIFTPIGYTERPAVACAKMCEGKIVVMVNGSPSAMIAPYLFAENFECLDDYGGTAYFATVLRVLKYLSFFITMLLPGAFVSISVYTPELLPSSILYRIASAEDATPLPLFAEMLLVILILEIIREAGLRMPESLGHSVSLVAALIVGDAAVGTGILSTPVILIAAVSSIAMFVTPSLYEPAALLRAVFLVASGLAGPLGFAFSLLWLIFAIAEPEILGVPYSSMLLPLTESAWKDGIVRKNLRELSGEKYNIYDKYGRENDNGQ